MDTGGGGYGYGVLASAAPHRHFLFHLRCCWLRLLDHASLRQFLGGDSADVVLSIPHALPCTRRPGLRAAGRERRALG